MANSITRIRPAGRAVQRAPAPAPRQAAAPAPQEGNWWWDGGSWQCGCDDDGGQPPFCPPPGWPPPGCPPWFSGQNSPPWYPGANAGVSFGTSPPPNPVRGHFYYDGTVLWIFDGAAWDTVGGATAAATPPVATPPANPVNGQQWFNGTTLYVWDGNAWVPVSQTKNSIGATAPPSPNPGDTWWDGTQFRIWDGSAWELVGPGATVGPVPTTSKVFDVSYPTAVSVPAGPPLGIVALTATPSVDTLGGWNPSTHQYMPTKAGFYYCQTKTLLAGSTYQAHTLLKNDSGTWVNSTNQYITLGSIQVATPGSEVFWLSESGMANMNGTTDFLRLWASDSSGTLPANGTMPLMQIWLLP